MNLRPHITCAVTGAGDTADVHPDLPISPAQIALSAVEAARAGAAIVHCHVRDPQTGRASRQPELYREVVERIRDHDTEVILNLTTGMGGDLRVGEDPNMPAAGTDLAGVGERMEHVEELQPEVCSLDCGSMNFGEPDSVYLAPFSYIRETAERLRGTGVKPELEVFEFGHMETVRRLIDDGLIDSPPYVQICLGIPYGAPADSGAMHAMVQRLPQGCVWSGFGVGRMQMPMAAQAVLLGGNIRVGLEDNLYLSQGVFASNAQLVERAGEIVERLGAEVAGPAEVRERIAIRAAVR